MSRVAPLVLTLLLASLWLVERVAAESSSIGVEHLSLRLPDGKTIEAEAGRIPVALRHAEPEGDAIQIAFVRVKGQAGGTPLIFLNGGPGQAATPISQDPEQLAHWSPYLKTRDVIFLDQRGIGASTPSLEYDSGEAPLPKDFFSSYELARGLVLASQRAAKAHFDSLGIDLGAYNTEESADDVDDLRAALGLEKIDLLGFSYGTLLAQTVLRRHPRGVERAVFVGTEGPRDWGSLPTMVEAQIEKISALAAEDSSVSHAVPDLRATLIRVLDQVEQHPLELEVRDERRGEKTKLSLGRWGLELLLRLELGDGNAIPWLPALAWTLEQGRTDIVAQFLEHRYNQLNAGHESVMSSAMRYSYGPTPSMLQTIESERGASIFHFMDNYFDLEAADLWSLPKHDDAFRKPIVTRTPALFVSGTLDLNAPPYQAEQVRFGFERSTHLVVDHAGHEDLLPDSTVTATIAAFLEGRDVSEARVTFPAPRFVGIRRR